MVVNGIPEETKKGEVVAIPLEKLPDYIPEFQSTIPELDYVKKLITKYERKENPAEVTRERTVRELRVLEGMIVQLK